MNTYELKGYHYTRGACRYLSYVVLFICIMLYAWGFFRGIFGIGVDDSDYSSWRRSGMKIYTDHKTGVQYLGNTNGITPRLTAQGELIVVGEKQ